MAEPSDLLAQLSARPVTRVFGVFDAVSARIAEEAGAQALWASGLCVSAMRGLADASIMTFDALYDSLRAIRRGSRLPLIADCDTGYGSLQMTVHMAHELARIGVTAMCIEDKPFPKVNSFVDDNPMLEPVERFAQRLLLVAKHRPEPSFALIARTEALVAGQPVAEALARARAYVEAGADAIIVHSKAPHPDQVLAFARNWWSTTPILVIPTAYPQLSVEVAGAHGVGGIIYANQLMRSSISAMTAYARGLAVSERIADVAGDLAPLSKLLEIAGTSEYEASARPAEARTRTWIS